MMVGDRADFVSRIRLTLPTRWFGDVSPILDALLSGFSTSWSSLYQLLQVVIQQSRVRTSTGSFLESSAEDYLSRPLYRRLGEDDDSFRRRLLAAMQRSGATKSAIIAAAGAAGFALDVFEAAQPVDTGAYNVAAGLAWNQTGAWGSLQMPLESLLVARRQQNAFEDELWTNLAGATPAGGALWLHIAN